MKGRRPLELRDAQDLAHAATLGPLTLVGEVEAYLKALRAADDRLLGRSRGLRVPQHLAQGPVPELRGLVPLELQSRPLEILDLRRDHDDPVLVDPFDQDTIGALDVNVGALDFNDASMPP